MLENNAPAAGSRPADAQLLSDLSPAEAVRQGDLLLSVLTRKAVAARAEAQSAELRLLLVEARAGKAERLQSWLRQQAVDQGDCQPIDSQGLSFTTDLPPTAAIAGPLAVQGGGPSREPPSADGESESPEQGFPSWDVLLPQAVARVGKRAEVLSSSVPASVLPVVASGAGSRMRGLTVSAAVHILLLLLLAFVTLKLPTPPASMALESAVVDSASEAVELSETIEVSVSPDIPETSTTPGSLDLSESLAEVSSSVSAISDITAVASSSLLSVAMDVSKSGKPNPLSSEASFFGAAASGNCFCYIIDSSPSMRGGPWEAAKLELVKSLSSLKEKQRFYVMFFDREVTAIPLPGEREPAPRALYASPANLAHAHRWIDTVQVAAQGWPPNDALRLAIAKEPDAIYLLTDGVTKVDVAQFLRQENRVSDLISGEQVRVPIHTIAFYSLEGQQLLKQIAEENRGQFFYVPDPRKLRAPRNR